MTGLKGNLWGQAGRPVLLALLAAVGWSQNVDLVAVVSKPLSRTVDLPGEFQPFLMVSLHAKVPGYVERVLVDRGSVVKQGQLLVELSAPELTARIAEAESRVHAAESDRVQAEAQLAAAQSTWDKLKKAAETPGAIAGNELTLAEKQVDAARALGNARRQTVEAAEAAVRAQKVLRTYLKITAPFDGVVTDRLVHPGALVGTGADARAAGDPAGLAPQAECRRAGAGYRRNCGRRQGGVPSAGVSGEDLQRQGGARGARTRFEDSHDAGGAGCRESRWFAVAGHVPEREVAGPGSAAGAIGAEDQRGHDGGAHLRDPRTRGQGGVGGCEEGRGGWR